jgi:hypothetical protein
MRGRRGIRRVLRVDHDLENALLVAKVDEYETAVIASRGNPAGDGHRPPNVVGPQ